MLEAVDDVLRSQIAEDPVRSQHDHLKIGVGVPQMGHLMEFDGMGRSWGFGAFHSHGATPKKAGWFL